MNSLPMPIRAALWWVLPLVALAAIIGWETDWGRAVEKRPQPPEPVAPKPVPVALLPDFEIAGGIAARTDTVQRTLFNPTRRPAPTAAQAGDTRLQRGQFALTGTAILDGKSTAFLREVAGNKSRRVQAGETINGLLVAEVRPDRVKLTLGGESEELVLRVATNSRPTVQPGGAAPAAARPVAAAPAIAPPAPVPPAAVDAATLAERRRAARAAAAVPPATAPAAQPAAPPAAAPVAADPRWEQMDQRYRERAVGAANRGVAQ